MRNRFGEFAARFLRRRSEDPFVLALRQLQSRGGRSVRRCAVIGLTVLATFFVVALTAAGLFAARLTQGPLSIADLGPRIAAALDEKVGAGYAFTLGATSIEASTRGLALSIGGLALRDTTGRPIIVAPKAEVSLDPLALLFGRVRPKRLDIFDVDVRLSVLPDGSVAVSAGSDPIVLSRPIGAPETIAGPAAEGTHADARRHDGRPDAASGRCSDAPARCGDEHRQPLRRARTGRHCARQARLR